jgi:BON domain
MSDFAAEWLQPVTEGLDEEFVAVRHGRTYRRRRISTTVPLLVGLLGMGLAIAGQFLLVMPHLEADLHTRITQQLASAGMGNLKVIMDGRDVVLDGTLPTLADVNRATTIVQGVDGVRAVREVFVSFGTPTPTPKASPTRTVTASPTPSLGSGFSAVAG